MTVKGKQIPAEENKGKRRGSVPGSYCEREGIPTDWTRRGQRGWVKFSEDFGLSGIEKCICVMSTMGMTKWATD